MEDNDKTQKTQFTIASALDKFDDETEEQLLRGSVLGSA